MKADCIIVGGGLVGNCIAALLSSNGLSCCIIEVQDQDSSKSKSIDPRALAITHASKNILTHTGIWKNLENNRTGTFRRMQVWDENGKGEVNFDAAELCQPCLGYIIEQTILENLLHNKIKQSELITWKCPARVKSVLRNDDKVSVKLDDGVSIEAKVLIGADGANSSIRNFAGINYPAFDYNQTAVACIVRTEFPHENTARQRFLTRGPLAFLPMADEHQCAIVWSTNTEHAVQLINMEDVKFMEELARAFDYRLGNIISNETRASFVLKHAQADKYCKTRVVLIGDAAHTIHPLAGLGANLGLLDAACLAETIISARNKGKDIGAYSVLRRYERWRKGDNFIMMKLMHGIKDLFGNQSLLFRHIRNIGLDVSDQMTPVKHLVMRHAMGLSGDLPIIARQLL